MPRKSETDDQDDQDDDDLYLFVALKLQDGRSVDDVRRLLAKKNVPAKEARTMVLNVYAAQKLQDGLKPSEVRKLLRDEGVDPEEARAIVAELRQATEEPAEEPAQEQAGGGGGALRGWGITLLILGIGSFILPLMNLQFRLLNALGDAAPVFGAVLAVVGAVLLFLSFRSN